MIVQTASAINADSGSALMADAVCTIITDCDKWSYHKVCTVTPCTEVSALPVKDEALTVIYEAVVLAKILHAIPACMVGIHCSIS